MAERSRLAEGVGNRRRLEIRKVVLGKRQFFMRLLEQGDKGFALALVRRFPFDRKGAVGLTQIGPGQRPVSIRRPQRSEKRLGPAKDISADARLD